MPALLELDHVGLSYHTLAGEIPALSQISFSIHCMDSWFCVVVIRNIRNVPGWHRVITWIWAVAICASTLFTKQHGILDVAAGIALAEICYACVVRWKKTERFRQWMEKKLA